MTISAVLTQLKVLVPSTPARPGRFAVRTAVSSPSVPALTTPFVLQAQVPGLDTEQFAHVASLTELGNQVYNPLSWFGDTVIDLSAVPLGSILSVSTPAAENILAGTPPVVDTVVARDVMGKRIQVSTPVWYRSPLPANWRVTTPNGIVLRSGTGGYYSRTLLSAGTWIDRQFMACFTQFSDAQNHILAVQSFFQTLLNDLDVDVTSQLFTSGTKPIVNTFTG